MDERTDKMANGLTVEYESAFRDLLHLPIRLLEIGIFRGGSLEYWDSLFTHPETRIVGIDLRIPMMHCSPRVAAFVCDQNDTEGLLRIAAAQGPFHIVIDDASHLARETRNCFNTLYRQVIPGGFYGIEDWGVGYWSEQLPEYEGMVKVVTDIVLNVPALGIGPYRVVVTGRGCLALFQKDVIPFQAKPIPPGIRQAEQYYRETVEHTRKAQ